MAVVIRTWVRIQLSFSGSPTLGQAGHPGRQSYNWDRFDVSLNRPNPPAYNSLPRQPAQGS